MGTTPDRKFMERFIEASENLPNIDDLLYAARILENIPSADEMNAFVAAVDKYRTMLERGLVPGQTGDRPE